MPSVIINANKATTTIASISVNPDLLYIIYNLDLNCSKSIIFVLITLSCALARFSNDLSAIVLLAPAVFSILLSILNRSNFNSVISASTSIADEITYEKSTVHSTNNLANV
jgi:hypothetical protein